MYPSDNVESKLAELGQQDFSSASEGLAALAEVTAMINAGLLETEPGGGAALSADLSERLERRINSLRNLAARVAKQFQALSYSISVGLPAGVSVSITWAPDN